MINMLLNPKSIKQKSGAYGRSSGLTFEENTASYYGGYNVSSKEEYVKDNFGKKTRLKTDVILPSEGTQYNYSLKNPKSKNTETQIQICSLNRLYKHFNINDQDFRLNLNLFCGNFEELTKNDTYKNNPKYYKEFLNSMGISTYNLNEKNELRRSRLFSSSLPNSQIILDFFYVNRTMISEMILSTGFCSIENLDFYAERVGFATEKNDPGSLRYFDISVILKKIRLDIDFKVNFKKSLTVICFGPFSIQMKGSGKQSAYHNIQFNLSWNNLCNYMGSEGEILK